MPIYSWNPQRWPYPHHPDSPIEVTDASGAEVDLGVMIDTDTGEVWRYVKDESGALVLDGDEVAVVQEFRPLPFTITPLSNDAKRIVGRPRVVIPAGEADQCSVVYTP
jgi:hypothetical protein